MKFKFTLFFLVLSFWTNAQVFINEIDADTPGTDNLEFVEIKSLTPNFSLNGYCVVFYNGLSSGTGTLSYHAIDLDGFTTDVNGNFVLGNQDVSPSPLLQFVPSLIQNGPDVVALYLANESDFPTNTAATATNLMSAVSYSNSSTTSPSALMSILGISTTYVDVQPVGSVSKSIQRKADGTYEVKVPTPSANNDGSGVIFNYLSTALNASTINEGNNLTLTFTTTQNVTSDLQVNFSISNGTTVDSADFSGTLSATILANTNSISKTIPILNDGIEEGDEETTISIASLPMPYLINNNAIYLRILDANYQVANFGTPLNPTYNNVTSSFPVNYYSSLENLNGAALKQAIQEVVVNPNVRLHSYADIFEILKTADQNPQNSGQVWCMYVEQPYSKLDQQTGSSGVGKWNREHIFPQSRGGFNVAQNDTADGISVWTSTTANSVTDGISDAHHLRAESSQENSNRSNKNYGTVPSSTVYAGITGNAGSWKGDVARALFYMAVRFNGLNVVNGDPLELNSGNPSGLIGDLQTLLSWHIQDPVDDFEKYRNNYIYTWQNNRNPFIDYPTLVNYVFGAQTMQNWNAPLSADTFEANEAVKIYPNPSKNQIFLEGIENITKARFFTITGQKVFETNEIVNNSIQFNLEKGIYFIEIENNFNKIVKKIVVN